MKQAPLIAKSCKRTKLLVIASDVELEIIFCGICVHELFFLVCYEDSGYSLLITHTMWYRAFLGCIFCGMTIFPL
jgi:hypothetical protein